MSPLPARTLGRLAKAAAIAAIAAMFGAIGAPGSAHAQVIKSISPFPRGHVDNEILRNFEAKANAALKGTIEIKRVGASEVVKAFEQWEALRNGVIDLSYAVGAFYQGQLPEAKASLGIRNKSPADLRKNGYFDLMREIHKEKGTMFLAFVMGPPGTSYRFYMNEPLSKPDLSGVKFRVSPTYIAFVRALGGTPINVPFTDLYTAIERNMIEGYGFTYIGLPEFSLESVTKFVIDHAFYTKDSSLQMNLNSWNKLSKSTQAEFEKIAVDVEHSYVGYMARKNIEEDAVLRKAGLKFVKFSSPDAKKYLELAYQAHWDEMVQKSPKYGARLRALGE